MVFDSKKMINTAMKPQNIAVFLVLVVVGHLCNFWRQTIKSHESYKQAIKNSNNVPNLKAITCFYNRGFAPNVIFWKEFDSSHLKIGLMRPGMLMFQINVFWNAALMKELCRWSVCPSIDPLVCNDLYNDLWNICAT